MSKIQRELFFSVPFFYFDVEDSNKLNSELVSDILKWRKEDKEGINRSNKSGWHSTIDMHLKEEFHKITKAINNAQEKLSIAENYHSDWSLLVESMWANVSPKYAHNSFHTHPNSLWSGVYYVQCPKDCGIIKFPNTSSHWRLPMYSDDKTVGEQPHQWDSVFYEPIEGRIILFPSDTGHEVMQNLTDVEGNDGYRISISFNSIQEHKGNL